MLQVRGLVAGYGGATALHGVDLAVARGQIVALLGANGSGRTTLLRAVSGLLRPSSGEVLLAGRPLQCLTAAKVVGAGVAQVPEGRRVFARLSVQDNLLMGAYATPAAVVSERLAEVLAMLPVLAERSRQAAGTLSGGEQQLLALGRALMSRPQ
ncbi:MAG: ATP-binding cassette domain-containing protein, partial [Frankiales bacterium]|nr:ATP-binding cassette domain-containing protein [Frankiales bacterium]